MAPRIATLLRASSTAALSTELARRVGHHRDALATARAALPVLGPAVERLLRSCDAAEAAADTPIAAVKALEDGTGAAVELLRDLPEPEVAHAVLSSSFDLLIGARSIGWRHQELADGVDESMFGAGAVDLLELVETGMEDASSFCREKYGASPEMELRRVVVARGQPPPPPPPPRDAFLLAPLVAFSLHELLKNAMGAHVRRVGGDAGRLDDLPPIDVSVGFHGRFGFVRVVDSGGGFPAGSDARRHGFKWPSGRCHG